jgi:hypothetical protein
MESGGRFGSCLCSARRISAILLSLSIFRLSASISRPVDPAAAGGDDNAAPAPAPAPEAGNDAPASADTDVGGVGLNESDGLSLSDASDGTSLADPASLSVAAESSFLRDGEEEAAAAAAPLLLAGGGAVKIRVKESSILHAFRDFLVASADFLARVFLSSSV